MKLHDLRKSPEEIIEERMPVLGPVDEYPCGTCLTLNETTLEKINVDHDDWQVGDIFEITGMYRVTAISCNETDNGERKCVTLQALMLGSEEEPDQNAKD